MIQHAAKRLKIAVFGLGLAWLSILFLPPSSDEAPVQCEDVILNVVGDWKQVEERMLSDHEVRILQADSHWQRVYVSQDQEKHLVVTLLAGPSGPLASHSPESCYARNAFFASDGSSLWTPRQRGDRFRIQTMQPRRITQPAITIAHAWHDGDHWCSPRFPRLKFAGRPRLQRLMITMRHPPDQAKEAVETIEEFIRLSLLDERV